MHSSCVLFRDITNTTSQITLNNISDIPRNPIAHSDQFHTKGDYSTVVVVVFVVVAVLDVVAVVFVVVVVVIVVVLEDLRAALQLLARRTNNRKLRSLSLNTQTEHKSNSIERACPTN